MRKRYYKTLGTIVINSSLSPFSLLFITFFLVIHYTLDSFFMSNMTFRDARNGPEMYVIGGEGQEGTVMKMVLATGQWFSLPGMFYPRRQHACTRVSLQGSKGIRQ